MPRVRPTIYQVIHRACSDVLASEYAQAVFAVVAWVAVTRLPFINADILSVDESVYLALGAGLNDGLIPYVDIVDRKPIGIYLIYAAADALFSDPLLGVRLFGMLATIGTGVMLMQMGRQFLRLSAPVATLSAVLYSGYALLFYGDAGQTPVFYMPFVVGGAWLVLREAERLVYGAPPSPARLAVAGLLLGLSLQIKYSTFFECIFFGALILVPAWKARDTFGARGLGVALAGAGAMLVGGLLPTAIAYAAYVGLGHADAFVFYNFTANLSREATDFPFSEILTRAGLFVLALSPLLVMSVRQLWQANSAVFERNRPPAWVNHTLVLWFVVALVGALAQRQPYATYFFDLLAPLSLLAASAFQHSGRKLRSPELTMRHAAVVVLLPVLSYVGMQAAKYINNGSRNLPSTIAGDIKEIGVSSMFNFNSFGIIHEIAHIGLPSRYPYPDHLLRDLEARSFQFDAVGEIGRILNENPDVILVQRPISQKVSADRRDILETKLAATYCLWRTYDAGRKQVEAYLHVGSGLKPVQTSCKPVARP